MEEYEIEQKIIELEQKLSYLEETVTVEQIEHKFGDAYFRDEKYTRGSAQEIERTKKMIAELKRELIAIKSRKERNEDMQLKNEIQEKRNHEKLFLEIQRLYKTANGRSFDKFLKAIQGKKPDWERISKYSQEELDYILKTRSGGTLVQEKIEDEIKKQSMSYRDKRKQITDSRWNEFTKLLQSENKLRQSMENEKEERRHVFR